MSKAKVEAGVRFAQTYILGRLRQLTFFSLAECNAAIALVMQRMNERPMRNLGLSRRELFEKIERDALTALPADDWEFAEWRRARVNLDYHIEVHDFLYSVPHALIRAEVDVRITARTVEIFHRGQRVGVHQRRYMGRKHGTDPDHMPSSHRRYAEWTPDRFRRWAGKIGPNTEGLISAVLASRPHPEQGFRTCLGILRSYRGLDPARLEAVSARAVELGVLNCKGVASLLARKRDSAAPRTAVPPRSSTTPICAVPATTIERISSCSLIPRSTNCTPSASTAWPKGSRNWNTKPEARGLDHAEWLGLLLEYELTLRRQKQFETRARVARLRHPASVEDVNYQSPRGLDRALFLKLAACDWIAERRNLLLTGASGLGKSWLACALGHKACRENLSVLYTRMPRLFADLAIAHGDARYARLLRSLARVKLLILDDWGPEALTPDQARDLLEIVEDRYDKGSLIITSQVPVDRWHDLIGVPTLADAILDRVIHNAYRIDLAGESLRKRPSSPEIDAAREGRLARPSARQGRG